MGAPSKTQVEDWSDLVSAMIQKDLDGYLSENFAKAELSLWNQVDLSGDPAVENALGASALAVDRQSLPENHAVALAGIVARAGYRDFASALQSLVMSADGGSHASLRVYLEAVEATLHPLFGELVRAQIGEGAFSDGTDVLTLFAPNYQSRAADRVYVGADGALDEETTDAGDVGTADVTLFAADDDCLYIGSRYKFNQVVVALSTLASVDILLEVKYWNGNAWTAVADLEDDSVGFTKNDRIKWTLPTDWQRHFQDAGATDFDDFAPLYYIRIQRTEDTVVTPPVGTCIRLIPAAVLTGSSHLGVDQPPLAIARITAADTLVVESVVAVDFARFIEPAIRLRALTPISQDLTPTVSYVDQTGADATKIQSAWTAPAALDEAAVVLDTGDTGVRSIRTTGWVIDTDADEGVFEVIVEEARTPAI